MLRQGLDVDIKPLLHLRGGKQANGSRSSTTRGVLSFQLTHPSCWLVRVRVLCWVPLHPGAARSAAAAISYLVEHLRVGGRGHKRDGQALGAKATRPAHAVQVGVGAVAVLLVCTQQAPAGRGGYGRAGGGREKRGQARGRAGATGQRGPSRAASVRTSALERAHGAAPHTGPRPPPTPSSSSASSAAPAQHPPVSGMS